MADLIPPMLIKLQADVSQLKSGLANAENAIKGVDKSVQQASTGMTNFATKIKQIGVSMGIAFASTQVLQFGKSVVMASSDMAESLSKVNIVFGEGASSVIEFGKNAATSLGISNQKALEAAGTYGNLFQALGVGRKPAQEMSTTLVQLASDLASFNNTSIDDALNALRSGLSGETEPLKRFGVALNDVTLKAKAFEMGFGQIKGVMDPAIKAQVTYALVMEQTKLAQGDYARTADGTANTMKTLAAQFQDAKVALGDALMPAFRALLSVLKILIPILESIGSYFKENYDAIKMYAIILATSVIAFYAVRGAIVATQTAMVVYTAVTKSMAAGHTLAAIATLNFRGAMMMLNMAIKANPIGAIITALTILGAAFVYAYKHSETFRRGVQLLVASVASALGKLLSTVASVIEAISRIPKIGNAFKGVASGIRNASNELIQFNNNLKNSPSLDTEAKRDAALAGRGPGSTGGTGGGTSGGGGGGLGDKAKKKLADYKKDVDKIYKDMYEVAQDARDKAQSVLEDRNDKFIKAQKNHDERVLDIGKDFAKRSTDLKKQLDDKLADLQANSAKRSADLTKDASDKQLSIIQESVNRLRNAFASSTAFSIADVFGGGKNAAQGIATLKKNLEAAKQLQVNAATLAGLGYSQTFIEEVVKQGPKAGNEIAQALKDASPEATKELQSLYNQVVSVSNNGLDDLAKSMNAGGKLATQELMDAYTQVAVDLKISLAEVDAELKASMADANRAYEEAIAEAKIARDEALADAAKTLQDALLEAQKDYEKAIDDINKSTMKKLEDLKTKLAEVAASMRALGAAQAASTAMANAPTTTPIQTKLDTLQTLSDKIAKKTGTAPINITQTFNSKMNAGDVAREAASAIKFGEVVKVNR